MTFDRTSEVKLIFVNNVVKFNYLDSCNRLILNKLNNIWMPSENIQFNSLKDLTSLETY